MKDVIFTSCAFGQAYLDQQKRLETSIREIYPEANLLFFRGRVPDKSRPFLDSLYGFKVWAIEEARERKSKVVFFDPAMLLVDKIDRLIDHAMIAVKDESNLSQSISDKVLNYVQMHRHETAEWNLVGGSFYYFDFETELANKIFDCWKDFEVNGYFGSQQEAASEQINSHRYDETCMALSMYFNNLKPFTPESVGYCTSENSIMQKKHFK